MKSVMLVAAAATVMALGAVSAKASVTLFSFEPGEEDMPFTGNASYDYTVGTSTTTGVTSGTQSLAITADSNDFGGALSSTFTDANAATLLDAGAMMTLDLTVPDFAFNYGNVDIHFNQPMNAVAQNQSQETNYSQTFALSSGSTIQLDIPLTLQSRPTGTHLDLDPTLPFSYQIDFSFAPYPDNPITFYADTLTVVPVPEPASLGAVAVGGLLLTRRRQRA